MKKFLLITLLCAEAFSMDHRDTDAPDVPQRKSVRMAQVSGPVVAMTKAARLRLDAGHIVARTRAAAQEAGLRLAALQAQQEASKATARQKDAQPKQTDLTQPRMTRAAQLRLDALQAKQEIEKEAAAAQRAYEASFMNNKYSTPSDDSNDIAIQSITPPVTDATVDAMSTDAAPFSTVQSPSTIQSFFDTERARLTAEIGRRFEEINKTTRRSHKAHIQNIIRSLQEELARPRFKKKH